MDLLDSILRAAGAQNYIDNFKDYNIDAFILPLLSDEDLQVIGVENEEIRKEILTRSRNLQIPTEKRIPLVVDDKYVQLVLHNISTQLTKHIANLSCAVMRKDTINCDVKLTEGALLLQNTISSFENQVEEFSGIVKRNRKTSRKKKIIGLIFIASLISTAVVIRRCIHS